MTIMNRFFYLGPSPSTSRDLRWSLLSTVCQASFELNHLSAILSIKMSAEASAGKSPRKVTAFENALQTWTELDLPAVQKKLDDQGLELKQDQKLSLSSRKELAQKTRDFKKLKDVQKLEQFNSLLKLYQNQIDELASKNKKAESYFFGFYRLIAEAPDPRPHLELSLGAVMELTEVETLKKQLADLTDELARKADYEVLKQRLLRNEQKSAELMATKLKAQEEEYSALIDEKEKNWQSITLQHDAQIDSYRATVEELKTCQEVANLQLSTQSSQIDGGQSSAAVLAEIGLLTRESETWKKRTYELERRNESLRRELSACAAESNLSAVKEDYERKLAEMESENVLIMANMKQVKKTSDTVIADSEIKLQTSVRELLLAAKEIKNLKEKLEARADYDDLKNELLLVRQIEFGDGAEVSVDSSEEKTLNTLLKEKNKELTNTLAEYRVEHETLVEANAQLQSAAQSSAAEIEQLKSLSAKLESDLASVQEASGSGGFNDNASLVSNFNRKTRNSLLGGSAIDESILPIITKQRDRFRERSKELEEDLRKNFNVVSDLKRKNKQLQTDNEELYEKTRYMASIKAGENNCQRNKTFHPKANLRDLENPYQTRYESKLHPIERFRLQEQERVNSRLSPFERLFIFLTRSILATRATRTIFLVYCLILHIVVMFTTIHSVLIHPQMISEIGMRQSTGGNAVGAAGA